jgi:excisionase family DNA binding protein
MVNRELEISPHIYYTPEETAALLRVSRRSILQLLESGAARGVKIGRHWRILGKDLLELPEAENMPDRQFTRSLMRLSEPAIAKVWDNDADAAYDELYAR